MTDGLTINYYFFLIGKQTSVTNSSGFCVCDQTKTHVHSKNILS